MVIILITEFVWVYNRPIDRILFIAIYGKDALAPHHSSPQHMLGRIMNDLLSLVHVP